MGVAVFAWAVFAQANAKARSAKSNGARWCRKATRCRTIESLVELVNIVLEYNYEKN